jgi:hypothetical protein
MAESSAEQAAVLQGGVEEELAAETALFSRPIKSASPAKTAVTRPRETSASSRANPRLALV